MDKDDDTIVTAGQILFFGKLEAVIERDFSEATPYWVLGDCFRSSRKRSLIHHEKHVKELGLTEASVEVYKTVAWHVWQLADQVHQMGRVDVAASVLTAGLEALNTILSHEAPDDSSLDRETLTLMSTMLMNELENMGEHGIARNGLFLAFKTSRAMKKAFKLNSIRSSNI